MGRTSEARRATVADVEHERSATGTDRITITPREDARPIVIAIRAGRDTPETTARALELSASAMRGIALEPRTAAAAAAVRRQRSARLITATCPECRAHRLVSDGTFCWCSDLGTRHRSACGYGKAEPVPVADQ